MPQTGMPYAAARSVGDRGEQLAVDLAQSLGWEIIERNWRCPSGEIDLVARDDQTLVVVEVKTRRSTRFGAPIEAITPAKLARLKRLAGAYVSTRHVESLALRVDVIGILLCANQPPQVQHLQGVA